MKKIIVSTFAMIFCCSGALTYAAGNTEINAALATKQNLIPFALDESTSSFNIIPGPNQTATTVIYVNRYKSSANGAVSTDPVRINCNGVLTIVNSGTSFTCYTPENKQSTVEIEPGFFKNGAEGFVISAE